MEIKFNNVLADEWLRVPVVVLGPRPGHEPTPDTYVTISHADEPLFRLDVYDDYGMFPFTEAIEWNGWIALGHGASVHLVRFDRSVQKSLELDAYFGGFWRLEETLLIASGFSLYSVNTVGEVDWLCKDLGFDGVVVEKIEDQIIHGEGEWDPPGGWVEFRVRMADGVRIK